LMLPENATDEQKRTQDGWDRTAGGKLRDLATSRGLGAVENHLWVEVTGMKGPLAETGVEKTKRLTSDIPVSLKDGSAPEG